MYFLGLGIYLVLFVWGMDKLNRKYPHYQHKLIHFGYIWGSLLVFVAVFAGGG